jgi:hypothetical protein
MLMERRLIASTERKSVVILGAVFDSVAREPGVSGGTAPIDKIDPFRRDQRLLATGPPVSRIDLQVTNRPRFIVEDKTADMPNAAVASLALRR